MASDRQPNCIRQGVTFAADAETAICEIRDSIAQPEMTLAILFIDPALGAEAVQAAMQRHWPDVPAIGTTASGHISLLGLGTATISAVSLAAPDFFAVADHLDCASEFDTSGVRAAVKRLVARLDREAGHCDETNTFAMMFMAYKSMYEERALNTIYGSLGGINLFGGAASRVDAQKTCWVLHNGSVRRDSIAVALVHTSRPFALFSTHHFQGTGERLVITGARPSERLVTEINGEPAALEYARLIGVSPEELRGHVYIERPVAVKIGDQYYLRSIERVNEDGTLLFGCALEIGTTLRVVTPQSMAANLETEFRRLRGVVGQPDLMIATDCAHRRLTLTSDNERNAVSRLLIEQNAVGFGSYGEQFNRTHLNHTLTGVAIGARKP
ncbi:MAG: FIST C-terminal domain-containing protein [Alphaproteobacteria bacterium]|nr:FIST C-terminal domain-containing protein [Alphaproteobacteria bacterium]MBU6473751.1 FIST C-terminal domain-containing protein [Alphaproteobacteria bacterium]MDE2013839.1 FIST C-terminal domain-containing protein [Alphaproteobacteria bacterium]MDE2074549.1 FIST C-terminal domain-containing protein [Alphaproteobacteria bacterium]MDE2351338.1 FIST C-terminal domain-containing protein [Alphaproteobacteria bacterium]